MVNACGAVLPERMDAGTLRGLTFLAPAGNPLN